MILSELQFKGFRDAAMPLMKWLSENCHPHVTVILDSERAELLEGIAAIRRCPDDDSERILGASESTTRITETQ